MERGVNRKLPINIQRYCENESAWRSGRAQRFVKIRNGVSNHLAKFISNTFEWSATPVPCTTPARKSFRCCYDPVVIVYERETNRDSQMESWMKVITEPPANVASFVRSCNHVGPLTTFLPNGIALIAGNFREVFSRPTMGRMFVSGASLLS